MTRRRNRKRKSTFQPQPSRNFRASPWKGAIRGAAWGALVAGAGFAVVFSGTVTNNNSPQNESSRMTILALPFLVAYIVIVGGVALVGYQMGGWKWAVGLPISLGAVFGGLGGAAGFWNLRRNP